MKRKGSAMPDSLRKTIEKQYPGEAWRMNGGKPPAAARSDIKPPAKKSPRGGLLTWRGTIRFDSATEANAFDALAQTCQSVIAHGKVALSDEAHIEPDFVLVRAVNNGHEPKTVTLQPGQFVGELADAKGLWRTKGGGKKAHAERDWLVKRKWLKDKTGLAIRIVSGDGTIQEE